MAYEQAESNDIVEAPTTNIPQLVGSPELDLLGNFVYGLELPP